jgi:hypothetical protein
MFRVRVYCIIKSLFFCQVSCLNLFMLMCSKLFLVVVGILGVVDGAKMLLAPTPKPKDWRLCDLMFCYVFKCFCFFLAMPLCMPLCI